MSPSLATKTYTYLYMYICTHIYFTSIYTYVFNTCIYSTSFSYKFHTIWVSTSKEMLLLVSPLLFEWRKYKTFHWCLYRARNKDPTVQNILFAKLCIPSPSTNAGRVEKDWVQPWGEGLGHLGCWESKLNPPMCICSPKTLGCLKSSVASRGCDFTPALLPHKTPPGALCSGVGSPVQQIHGRARPWGWSEAWTSSAMVMGWDSQGCSAWKKRWFQRPYSNLQYLKGLWEIWRGASARAWSDGTRTNDFKWKRVGLNYILRINSLLWQGWGAGTDCPEKLWLCHAWKCSRPVGWGIKQSGLLGGACP